MTGEELYEALVQWPAYQELHDRLSGDEHDPRTSDPGDLVGCIARYGQLRAAAAIYATYITADLDDAEHVVAELLELAAAGRRPRYGREITPDFYAQLQRALNDPSHSGGATP